LQGWLADAQEGAARRTRDVIRQGFVEGRSAREIARQLRGTKALQFKDGILEISRRSSEAMVRTAITHTASVASQETYKSLGVAKWKFLAVLDARTTITCAALSGKTFDVNSGPMPPRHVNCRSTTIPVVEGVPEIEIPSYAAWLRRQPVAVQDDILGKTKGRLFREAGLPVDRFVDGNGKVLTLEQLRKRDAGAFERL
jgi:SPP1 gp7 family putative phage head morphogenesis protein